MVVNSVFVMSRKSNRDGAPCSASLSMSAATFRVLLRESEVFLRAKATEVEMGIWRPRRQRFSMGEMLMKRWLLYIRVYAVTLLMTGELHTYCHSFFKSSFLIALPLPGP